MGEEEPWGGPFISAWEVLASTEHDKHVQVLLRARPLEYRDSMLPQLKGDEGFRLLIVGLGKYGRVVQ